MSGGVRFTDTFVAEMRPALTLEDVYQYLASYGGIHRFSFDSLLSTCAPFDPAEWDTADGTWTFDQTQFTGQADGSGGWHVAWWKGNGGDAADNKNFPQSFALEVDTGSNGKNAVIAFRSNGLGDFYAVYIDTAHVTFYKVEDGTWSVLENADYSPELDFFVGPASLRLVVRQVMFSEKEIDRWLFLSLWIDDRLVLAARDHLPDSTPGLRWGLGYRNTTTNDARYTRVRVPDMTEIIPWSSIDPGETPLQGIQRSVADRVIKGHVRYDGTLRVWRPKASAVQQMFGAGSENHLSEEYNLRELYNHVRLYYALDWVEVFDGESYEAYGHRFIEMTNTYIEDEDEAYREVLAILRRLKESAFRCEFRTKGGGLLLEPEDRVTLSNGKDYLIESITLEYRDRGLVVSLKGRQYAYES